MHLSRYLKVYPVAETPDRFLLYSTLRGSAVTISGATLKAAGSGCPTGTEMETLKRLGMLVEDTDREREQMRTILERARSRSRRFTALAVLNLDCNLDCGYCYEGGFRGQHYMTRETARLLAESLIRERMAVGTNVTITFYGGEPLLSEDLIVSISGLLNEAAKRHGVRYDFNLVTNGTLLNRETAKRLIPLGLKGAKFTLDGPREIHDRQRPFASGYGSFDTILDNLWEVCGLLTVQLGGNFYRENYHDFPRLLDQLLERGVTPDKLAQVLFTPITPKAGCKEQGADCSCPREPWLIEALPFLQAETLARGFAASKLKVSACMVESDNNLVVNYDGSLYKCPAFMGWDGFSIGTLAGGCADYSASHGIGHWQNDQCLDCSYLPLCFGGCRFINLLQNKKASELDCRREFLDGALERLVRQNLTYRVASPAAGHP